MEKVFKNTSKLFVLNVVTQLIVGLSGFVFLPKIFDSFGNEEFGIYSIVIIIFNTAILLDFGIGKAVTFNISKNIKNKEYISHVVFFSFTTIFLISIAFTIFFYIANQIFRFDFFDKLDSKGLLYYIPISIPILLFAGLTKNILEGFNKLKASIFLKFLLNGSLYIIPFICIFLRFNLNVILNILIGFRLIVLIPFLIFFRNYYTNTLTNFSKFEKKEFLKFAGWTSIANILTPIIGQFDKFLILKYLTISSLPYYTLPLELINGILILPSGLSSIMYPKFCSGIIDLNLKKRLLLESIKYLILLISPFAITYIFFSSEILTIWQNMNFANHSARISIFLLIGSLIFSIGWFLSNFIIGNGRPDIPSKVLSIEMPVYIILAYFLLKYYGLIGLSIAFLIRSFIQFGLYSSFIKILFKLNILKFFIQSKLFYIGFEFFIILFTLKITKLGLLNSFILILTISFITGFFLILEKNDRKFLIRFIK